MSQICRCYFEKMAVVKFIGGMLYPQNEFLFVPTACNLRMLSLGEILRIKFDVGKLQDCRARA